jgi:Integrase core domain
MFTTICRISRCRGQARRFDASRLSWISGARLSSRKRSLPRRSPFPQPSGIVLKFLLRSRASASGGFMAEAVGTRQGPPRSLRPPARRLRRPVTEPSSPLPCRKSHEAGALTEFQNFVASTQELRPWLHQYNWHRPHGSLGWSPPVSRSALDPNNLLSLHT